jgi:GR25 family glycosyltransferase involved in LPS biosynthesis
MDFKSMPKFCISLKRNEERREAVSREFFKFGIHNVTFFDAVDKRDLIVPELSEKLELDGNLASGILGCMLSHVALIKKAKELGLKEICIFEDDIIFCDDFNRRIAYLESLNLDFDMITLGGHFTKPHKPLTPNDIDAIKTNADHIYRVMHQGGTYAYIINENVYDFIIRNCTYNYGMDQFYSDHVYSRFNCYAFVPFLVSCAQTVSDITDSSWMYENIDWFYIQGDVDLPKIKTKVLDIETIRNFSPPEKLTPVQKTVLIHKKTKATNLLDCTFITAVKIESPDRKFNFLRVIQYLCDNFATNIIIKEMDNYSKVVEILPWIERKECNITFTFEKNESNGFHRTRLLNEALIESKTPITVNYDIDVFMKPEAYVAARDKILEGWDLVYPFKKGDEIQKQVSVPQHVKDNYKGEDLFTPEWQTPWQSYCGHVQFFNTESYIAGGMENEYFISYGPEDRERMERFQRLGHKVMWGEECVYHLEHSRDENSSTANPHFGQNEALMHTIREKSLDELQHYYSNVAYLKKYRK